MKKFIIAALLLISAATAQAKPVTFQWDANTEPDLVGYKLYCKAAPAPTYNTTPPFILVGATNVTTLTADLDITIDAQNCAVTAYNDSGLESGYSNVVVIYPFVPPAAPKGLRKK